MTIRSAIAKVCQQEDLNFLLTNRIPRRLLTQFMGWFSKIENPIVRELSIGIWAMFSDLDLSEAKNTKFKSMHDCFTRELKEGARPIHPDPAIVVSPCDAIVGACGTVQGTELLQVKGFPYTLDDLLLNPDLVEEYRDGRYITLRLTSSMYHRFHAPYECRVEQVSYISGDTWNVNPIALKRIEKLFCKNERALIRTRLPGDQVVTLVPVAAILVASIQLNFLNVFPDPDHRGPNVWCCDAPFRKGQEIGWFQHGSTIIVFAPDGLEICENIEEGKGVRMGQPLMRFPQVESYRARQNT